MAQGPQVEVRRALRRPVTGQAVLIIHVPAATLVRKRLNPTLPFPWTQGLLKGSIPKGEDSLNYFTFITGSKVEALPAAPP